MLIERDGHLEREFAARFQQFTPAVMAKGVEDTAFYRYNRLVSCERGWGRPGKSAVRSRVHEYCTRLASLWPATMLTLSTHDTKRSADVRARIGLLSEIPLEWGEAVRRWGDHNQRHRSQGYPDRNIEYLMYQTLVGAWPLEVPRLSAFLQKAAREARVHTSWINPVSGYEDAYGIRDGSAGRPRIYERSRDVPREPRHRLARKARRSSRSPPCFSRARGSRPVPGH